MSQTSLNYAQFFNQDQISWEPLFRFGWNFDPIQYYYYNTPKIYESIPYLKLTDKSNY